MGHRLAVYFGLADDPELLARWERGGVDARTRVVGFALALLVLAAVLAGGWLVARAL